MSKHRTLRNKRNNATIAAHAVLATSFFARLRGLLGRRSLGEDEALIIQPCKSVHMFFMLFPIDAVFCSAQHRVLEIIHEMKPWRVSSTVHLAEYVVELPAGKAKEADIQIGDEMVWSSLSGS